MAFCIYCGTKLGDSDRFCGNCGNKVEIEESAAAPAATIVYSPAPAEEKAVAGPAEQESAPAAEPVADPAVEAAVFSAPVEEEIAVEEEPAPKAPLYAAPITREHVRTAATPAAAQPMPFGNKSARGSSASYSYATKERVANPVQNKAVRPKRKFLAAFFSVILCILLLVAMLPTYTLFTVRGAITQETFLAALKRVQLSEIPGSVLDESDRSLRGKSVAEALCDELNLQLGRELPDWEDLEPQELDQFLDDTAFLPFIAEHAEGIVKAVVNGKSTYRIPTQQIVDLLEHDVEYLTAKLGIDTDDVDLDQLSDDIVEEFQLEDLVLPERSDMDEETRMALDMMGILLSFYPIAACCLVLLLLVLLLFAANHRDPMYAIRDVGIVSVVGTVIPLLLVFGARGAVAFFAGQKFEEYVASLVASSILDSTFLGVACVFGLGVVLLIINGIVRKVQKRKEKA